MSIFRSPEGKPECPECKEIEANIRRRLSSVNIYNFKEFLSRKAFKWLDYYEACLSNEVYNCSLEGRLKRLKDLEGEVDQFFGFLRSLLHIMEEGKKTKESQGKPLDTSPVFALFCHKYDR